jgi:hypothetical protein
MGHMGSRYAGQPEELKKLTNEKGDKFTKIIDYNYTMIFSSGMTNCVPNLPMENRKFC